jgi:formylglycine-generating enzyme required for sulfatase activity/DNA-binding CsgD family transcriptional regulator
MEIDIPFSSKSPVVFKIRGTQMANKENISLLSKYQMKVLYYKCKEGATHEEIAEILGRDVNTIQYHMTKIYRILEISAPGKSKEEMDSELKNEIGPIIRQMFPTVEAIKTWAPSVRRPPDEEEEEGTEPPYQPPPSLQKVLQQTEKPPASPEVLKPPPPPRPRIRWRRAGLWIIIGLVILIGVGVISNISASNRRRANTPGQPTIAQPFLEQRSNVLQTPLPTNTLPPASTPTATQTSIPTPIQIVTQVSDVDQMVLVYVPAGEFKMGSTKADDAQALDEEIPQHTVYLDAYWIDQTEVTNAQYALCVASGACTKPADNISLTRSSYYDNSQYASYPVIYVSWNQANAYCTWAGGRLPSEAMWEKAARGPDGLIFPWGNDFDGTKVNYCDRNCPNGWKDDHYDDGYNETAPVGDYPEGASVYGALDMAGNVYEWTADWYEPYRRTRQENPAGPLSGSEHIIRGGSWGDDLVHVRAAVRSHKDIPESSNFIGFRCAR